MADLSEEQKLAEAKIKIEERRKKMDENKRLRDEELKSRNFGPCLKIASTLFLCAFGVYAVVLFAVWLDGSGNNALNASWWSAFLKWMFGGLIETDMIFIVVGNILSFAHYIVCFIMASSLLKSSMLTLKEFRGYFAADIVFLSVILLWLPVPFNTFISYDFNFISLLVVLAVAVGLILSIIDLVKYKKQANQAN